MSSISKNSETENETPVITIDGPSGSGKGTIAKLLAQKLGWHLLDSGALYRVLALAAKQHTLSFDDAEALEFLAIDLDVEFVAKNNTDVQIFLDSYDVTEDIRKEDCSIAASHIAALPFIRRALFERQRMFKRWPGLVADGRDMGTVVFPEAQLKIFLYASDEERAKRRYLQLQAKGINVSLAQLLGELQARDERDKTRAVAPLKPAEDAIMIDTTDLTIEQVLQQIMSKKFECFTCTS